MIAARQKLGPRVGVFVSHGIERGERLRSSAAGRHLRQGAGKAGRNTIVTCLFQAPPPEMSST